MRHAKALTGSAVDALDRLGLHRMVLVAVVCATAAGVFVLAGGRSVPQVPGAVAVSQASAATSPRGPPSAAEFAEVFVGVTNAFAEAHGDPRRLSDADCGEGDPGNYICSYLVTNPGHPSECRLMQAMWTPNDASSFAVTLSGRSLRCGSLREAIQSLQ